MKNANAKYWFWLNTEGEYRPGKSRYANYIIDSCHVLCKVLQPGHNAMVDRVISGAKIK